MRRNRAGRASSAQHKDSNQYSQQPRRENNKKEDDQPSILTAGGLIFMALCLSALSSGLGTEKDLTPKSETTNDKEGQTDESKTTIDPKKGQANNSGAEKNPNSPITPSAIPPAPAPTNLIHRFFALWASPTPTKEDNTKTTAQTADASPKSVSFEAPPKNGKRYTGQSVNPGKTTEPAPPTSILKQTNPSVNEPKTASAPSILKSLFSFFSKDTQAPKDNSPALVEVGKTSGAAPELTSDNKPPQAKRAKTEISPEDDKAMKSLINQEVMKRMSQQDNPDNSILVLQNQKRVEKNEVTLDFKNKFEIGDSDFMERLEKEKNVLASLEKRTKDAFSFRSNPDGNEKNPNAKSKSGAGGKTDDTSTKASEASEGKKAKYTPETYAALKLNRPPDYLSVRTMDEDELGQHNRDIQTARRAKITKASQKAIDTYLNSPQQVLKREEGNLAQLKESNNGLTSAGSKAGPTLYNTKHTSPENGTEDRPQTDKRNLTKASDVTGRMGKVLKEEGWIKIARVNTSPHGGPSPCAHGWTDEIQAPSVRESGGKGKGGGGR